MVLTIVMFLALAILFGIGKRQEVMANWPKYRMSPLYMATAFLYKPDKDPRSRLQFTEDNFKYIIQFLLMETLRAVLAPIFDIFQVTGGGILGSIQGSTSIHGIMANMLGSFNKVFSIFENRYTAVLHRLGMTFLSIQNSMNRIWAVAASSIYLSMSNIAAMLSALDLIIKIVIIILVILVAIVFFLFLFMWPFVPVILSVIGILVTAGAGAAVGGMASTFCFAGNTPVLMADGSTKPMQAIQIGDALGAACGEVTGCLEFLQACDDELYELDGIHVTGSHIVWHEGRPLHVADHPAAKRVHGGTPGALHTLYCLNTTTQRIPVVGNTAGVRIFSDWEEITEDAQLAWNKIVFEALNPGMKWEAAAANVDSEAAFHPATRVQCPKQDYVEIAKIRPGMYVLDELGLPTRVLGVVAIANDEVESTNGFMSAAVWRRSSPRSAWTQDTVAATDGGHPAHTGHWYSLITESGTFKLIKDVAVRDFTDVGLHEIAKTYTWVLEVLGKTAV